MKKNLYSIYDKKATQFQPPFIEVTDASAIRLMQELMTKKTDSQYALYPDDFVLYNTGFFNIDNGEPEVLIDGPQIVVELKSIMPKEE